MFEGCLKIPLEKGANLNCKRVYTDHNHWLEFTCPRCVTTQRWTEGVPLFSYGHTDIHFCCDACGHEQKAAELVSILAPDNTAVIKKSNDFNGRVAHCYYERVVADVL